MYVPTRAMGKKQKPVAAAASVTSPKKQRGMAIPDVAEMGSLVLGGSTQPKPVFDDQIHIGLMEYAKRGSIYSDTFGAGKLWVAQMATSRQPNPLFQMKKLMELYGQATAGAEDPPPATPEDLELRYKAVNQFVWKKTEDKDDIGWKKNRMGWYIDEEYVKEFLMYFDDIMDWRKGYQDAEFEKIEGEIKIVIHILKTSSLELKLHPEEDELKCRFEVVREEQTTMSVFDLPPPIFPARIVVLTFQVLAPEKVHAVFSGNTKPFQAGFVRHGIKGKSVKIDPQDPYGEYLRVLEHLDLADENKCMEHLKNMFDDVLLGSPIVIRVKETKHDLENLKTVVNHFKTTANIRIEM